MEDMTYYYLGYQRGYHAGVKKSVTHGRWVDDYDDYVGYIARCSVCGKKVLHAVSYDLTGERYEMNYCPNCGAKMDEVNGDE